MRELARALGATLLISDDPLSPGQERNLDARARSPRHRPDRPDPRHLRPACPDERGQAPGRAGPAHVPPAAARGSVGPPRAARRRHRDTGTRRDPARVGPARGPSAHRARSTRRSRTSSATGGSSGRTGATSGCPSSPWSDTPTPARRRCSTGSPAPAGRRPTSSSSRSTPSARLVSGGGRAPLVLTDTVGFIQKLPTQLVAAFKATLEELEEAQLLLHVVDVSHPHAREHMSAVHRVLAGARAGGSAGADGDEQDRPPGGAQWAPARAPGRGRGGGLGADRRGARTRCWPGWTRRSGDALGLPPASALRARRGT